MVDKKKAKGVTTVEETVLAPVSVLGFLGNHKKKIMGSVAIVVALLLSVGLTNRTQVLEKVDNAVTASTKLYRDTTGAITTLSAEVEPLFKAMPEDSVISYTEPEIFTKEIPIQISLGCFAFLAERISGLPLSEDGPSVFEQYTARCNSLISK